MQIDIKVGNTYKLVDTIKHQGIGGQIITLEREISLYDLLDMNTIGATNFILRRPDMMKIGIFTKDDIQNIIDGITTQKELDKYYDDILKQTKIYYGHINGLGYFVAADEIVEEVKV